MKELLSAEFYYGLAIGGFVVAALIVALLAIGVALVAEQTKNARSPR